MKNLAYFVAGLILASILISSAHAQTIYPNRGGTGVTTTPSVGQVLVGQPGGVYAPQATSTLGIQATLTGGSTSTLTVWTGAETIGATSSPTVGFITATSGTSTLPRLSTSFLSVAGDYLTDITGTGLQIASGALQTTLGSLVDLVTEVTGVLGVGNGGTGTSTVPTAGQVMVGQSNGTYGPRATSTLGLGTVTSVGMTVPTGLSIAGSPVTTSGTLALTLTSGYVIPTTTRALAWDAAAASTTALSHSYIRGLLSSSATGLTYTSSTGAFSLASGYNIPLSASTTGWNTAYLNRITSLTTTGTSGAATLTGNTLNIPQYTDTNYLTNSGANLYPNTGTYLQAPVLQATSTTEASTIAYRLGIGTTTPDTALNVLLSNNLALFKTTGTSVTAAIAGIRIAESGSGGTTGDYWDIKADGTIDGNFGFSIGSNAVATAFNIARGTGNVGIGSTTPYAKLSVTNTTASPSFVVEDSTSPDTTPFVVDASGNVGIGTTTPGSKLTVSGATNLDGVLTVTGTATSTIYSGLEVYVSVREHVESAESVVIGLRRRAAGEGRPCGRPRTDRITTAASCATRVI